MLRPPIEPMHAAPVRRLPEPDSCAGGCVYEPKWDGWRALVFVEEDRVYLQSRSGRPLAAYFPDISRLARNALPAGTVVDGELIIWEAQRAATSFALLQRRVSAGRHLPREVAAHPAHLVVFDLLHTPAGPLLSAPLAQRAARLTSLLADAPPQLTRCPQTVDPQIATDWMRDWADAGVEGLVIKGLAGTYQPGRRGWAKLRTRTTTEAIVGGVTGSLADPGTLLLGHLDRTAHRPPAAAVPPGAARGGRRRGGGPRVRARPMATPGHVRPLPT
ncbi:MAG: hypothetical protein FWJ93_06070 [Micromonosporaceae bacterium]